MVVKYHTTVPAQQIDDELRRSGRCRVRLPNTIIEFEITHRGVEVVAENMRYVMHQYRDVHREWVTFSVTVDGRCECTTHEGFDGQVHFYVLDKAGDPMTVVGVDQYGSPKREQYSIDRLTSPANEKRKKVLLLCQ